MRSGRAPVRRRAEKARGRWRQGRSAAAAATTDDVECAARLYRTFRFFLPSLSLPLSLSPGFLVYAPRNFATLQLAIDMSASHAMGSRARGEPVSEATIERPKSDFKALPVGSDPFANLKKRKAQAGCVQEIEKGKVLIGKKGF